MRLQVGSGRTLKQHNSRAGHRKSTPKPVVTQDPLPQRLSDSDVRQLKKRVFLGVGPSDVEDDPPKAGRRKGAGLEELAESVGSADGDGIAVVTELRGVF